MIGDLGTLSGTIASLIVCWRYDQRAGLPEKSEIAFGLVPN